MISILLSYHFPFSRSYFSTFSFSCSTCSPTFLPLSSDSVAFASTSSFLCFQFQLFQSTYFSFIIFSLFNVLSFLLFISSFSSFSFLHFLHILPLQFMNFHYFLFPPRLSPHTFLFLLHFLNFHYFSLNFHSFLLFLPVLSRRKKEQGTPSGLSWESRCRRSRKAKMHKKILKRIRYISIK